MKKPLWVPSSERMQQAQMTQWMDFVRQHKGVAAQDYWDFHRWSVQQPAAFWESLCTYLHVQFSEPYHDVMVHADDMLNTRWFSGARLNYAEHLLRVRSDQRAIIFCNELGHERCLTYHQLADQVAQTAQALKNLGIKAGDPIVGYMPNVPETVVAMLAAASLGAIWSSTSPDFGYRGVLDRFGQIEPKVLFTTDGYFYKGKAVDSLSRLPSIIEAIPSLQQIVIVPYISDSPNLSSIPRSLSWFEFLAPKPSALSFAQLPFDHPLFIMYSSGTTGVPKCIVHGAGGTLLQHLKEHRLHVDLRPNDVFFYFTTCGWMMWNWLVSGLASQATLLLFDGSPFHPGPEILWKLAEKYGVQVFGTSAKYLAALEKTGYSPRQEVQLDALRTVLSTGSPLSEASFHYVYRDIKTDVHLASISGGTDLLSCFALGNPQLPVYSEELQCPGLGMNVHAFDETGKSVVQEKGELVCTTPFPCQPIYFWNDPEKQKYKSAYFDVYPNVWHHGDFIEITDHRGIIMYGRSDATLNPGGVRIGTSEIYRAIESMPEMVDSLVVGRDTHDQDVEVLLFVKLAPGLTLDTSLKDRLKQTIRQETTPRHVPAEIHAVSDIPYTISGKKVEMAVRRIIHGMSVPNRDALANPESLDLYKAFQHKR